MNQMGELYLHTRMPADELRSRLVAYAPWRYAIDFSNGVNTGEFERGDWFVERPLEKLGPFEEHIAGLRGGAALDVGCNIGHHSLHLHNEYGMQVIGIDSSARNIELAQLLAEVSDASTIRYNRADANVFLTAEPVDLILHLTVLYYLRDPFLALRNTARMLKPGGLLALEHQTYSGGDGTLSRFYPHASPADAGKPWWSLGKEVVLNMLRASGYGEIKVLNEWRFSDEEIRTLYLARRSTLPAP